MMHSAFWSSMMSVFIRTRYSQIRSYFFNKIGVVKRIRKGMQKRTIDSTGTSGYPKTEFASRSSGPFAGGYEEATLQMARMATEQVNGISILVVLPGERDCQALRDILSCY